MSSPRELVFAAALFASSACSDPQCPEPFEKVGNVCKCPTGTTAANGRCIEADEEAGTETEISSMAGADGAVPTRSDPPIDVTPADGSMSLGTDASAPNPTAPLDGGLEASVGAADAGSDARLAETGVPDASGTTCGGLSCSAHGKCEATGATPRCVCDPGYQGVECAADIDECAAPGHGCSPAYPCVNLPGGHTCSVAGSFGDARFGRWRMDEASWTGSQGEVRDTSGRTAANHGSALYGANTVTDGRLGRAGAFNGYNQAVELPAATTLELRGDMTVAAWIQSSAVKSDQLILQKLDTSLPRKGWSFRLSGDTLLFFTDDYTRVVQASAASCLDGSWHHVAAVKRVGAPMELYIDGKRVATYLQQQLGTLASASVGIPAWISWGAPAWAFEGRLDDVQVFGKALNDEEIAQVLTAP